ncbi:MAG: acylphosphatase [Candidatus Methanoperedens sp.]|nr:acylphosphatase [Candidatus Methanoperedens sp.]
MEKRKILINGPKVHGVGYRAFLLDEAEALLMPNFSAKNIKNGTEVVEVLVGGTKENIDIFIKFVKNNYPEETEVADISFEDYDGDIRTIEAYSRSFSASQLSKIAMTGVSLVKNQKDHIKITKEIVKKQDEHIGISREILYKQDEHIALTEKGFNSVIQELKSFKDVHREILELRQEITALKSTVSRIEKMVEA